MAETDTAGPDIIHDDTITEDSPNNTGDHDSPPEGTAGETESQPTIVITRDSHSATISSVSSSQSSNSNPRHRATTGTGSSHDHSDQKSGGNAPSVRFYRHSDVPRRHHRHQYQEYIPAGGMYVVYEKSSIDSSKSKGSYSTVSPPTSFDPYDPDSIYSHRDSRLSTASTRSNTYIGEIDGRFSFSEGRGVEDYVRVEVNADGSSTSHELMQCKKTVLKPYLLFLKLIGWRRLKKNAKDNRKEKLYTFINVLYPTLIFIMLVATILSQQLSCFSRITPANLPVGNQSFMIINCTNHLFVGQILPGLLVLASFLYGVYIFQIGEPEHFAALMETVFLSYSNQMGASKKKIINTLRFFLAFGILWIALDVTLNIMRLGSLQLLDKEVFIDSLLVDQNRSYDLDPSHTIEEHVLRYFFVLFSLVGFIFFDLLYFAVVVAYISQSQLIQYYIVSIIHKVRAKTYSLQDAVKDVRQTYSYLQILNSKLSTLTSLQLFIFIFASFTSVYRLAAYPAKGPDVNSGPFYLGIFVGLGNIIQWSLLAGAPIVQAARLTARCRQLRRLGLEIGSRPFVYAGTPQLDLHYFLQFTNSTRYTAKLASIPISPAIVGGVVFLGGIIGGYITVVYNLFAFAPWF